MRTCCTTTAEPVLDHDGITLRRYYFPLGTSKHIPYSRIRAVRYRPMG